MLFLRILFLCIPSYLVQASSCVCTTVSCPVAGNNSIIMGNGNADMQYMYEKHKDYDVVISASGTITTASLDHGTDTTSCTQKYSRMLEDDGNEDCDAGHILANRLGGYGNIPINIFPQNPSINRGAYAQFEGNIYECMTSGAEIGHLSWEFYYESIEHTMPNEVKYMATFDGGKCKTINAVFPN
jgi:hypothetical protein